MALQSHTHTHTHTYIQIRIITTVWSSLYHHKRSHSFLICMRERERESSVLHLLPSHTGILILIFIFFSSLFSMVHPSLAPPPPAGSIVDVSPLLLSPVQYSSASSCAHVITAAIPLRSASVITLHTHIHTYTHTQSDSDRPMIRASSVASHHHPCHHHHDDDTYVRVVGDVHGSFNVAPHGDIDGEHWHHL